MKPLVLVLCLIFACACLRAQTISPDSTLTDKFLLDFTVPDMPAFKALGTDPSSILRPSDIQKFAAAFSPWFSNGQTIMPKNFALAVAPWKLASRNWSLGKYASGWNSFLYNSSFSLGTNTDSGKYSTKLSLGYHFSIVIGRHGDILKDAIRSGNGFLGNWRTKFWQAVNAPAAKETLKIEWYVNIKKYKRSSYVDSADSKTLATAFLAFVDSLSGPDLQKFHDAYPNEDTVKWKKLFDDIAPFYATNRQLVIDSIAKIADTLGYIRSAHGKEHTTITGGQLYDPTNIEE